MDINEVPIPDKYIPETTSFLGYENREIAGNMYKVAVFEIKNKDFIICERLALGGKRSWIDEKKPNPYNKGICNTKEDIAEGFNRPKFTGALGEMALAIFLDSFFNTEYKKNGDKGDFIFPDGTIIDVKNSVQLHSYNPLWFVTAKNEGDDYPLKSDIYVCGFLEDCERDDKFTKVVIVGFQYKDYVAERPIVPGKSKNAKHKNREIPIKALYPIEELLDIYHYSYIGVL